MTIVLKGFLLKIILTLFIFLSTCLFASEIKVKVKQHNNITKVKALFGSKIQAYELLKIHKENHISSIKIKADNTLVFDMKASEHVSVKPIIKFNYKTIDSNFLHVEVKNINGNIETYTRKIKKEDRNKTLKKYIKLDQNPKKYKTKLKTIQKRYGDITLIEDGIELSVPDISSNPNNTPVEVRSSIEAISVALFVQVDDTYFSNKITDKTMELVCEWFQTPQSMVDYHVKIRMKYNGDVRVVIQAKDGRFYTAVKYVTAPTGGGN